MNQTEWEGLIATLLDEMVDPKERTKAGRDLGACDDPTLLANLLDLAQRPDLPTEVGEVVGEAVAKILHRQGRYLEAPLHNFTGASYIGFDNEIARLLRGENVG